MLAGLRGRIPTIDPRISLHRPIKLHVRFNCLPMRPTQATIRAHLSYETATAGTSHLCPRHVRERLPPVSLGTEIAERGTDRIGCCTGIFCHVCCVSRETDVVPVWGQSQGSHTFLHIRPCGHEEGKHCGACQRCRARCLAMLLDRLLASQNFPQLLNTRWAPG